MKSISRTIVLGILLGIGHFVSATVYLAAGSDVQIKANPGGIVKVFTTDKDGVFHAEGLSDGTYDLFLYDQGQPPIAKSLKPNNGEITGKVTLEIEDKIPDKKVAKKKLANKPKTISSTKVELKKQ
jgi:hypothetical protein